MMARLWLIALVLFTTNVIAKPLVVSAKKFTEHQIISAITAIYLRNQGYKVKLRSRMGTTFIRKSILDGNTDLYWGYTGTAFLTFHHQSPNLQTPANIYQTVKRLDAKNDLVWLNPSEVNNTYALAINSQFGHNITNISELAAHINANQAITFGCNFEFCRVGGEIEALESVYGFKIPRKDVEIMDLTSIYSDLATNKFNMGLVFATDSKLFGTNFVLLKDDKNFFTSYALTPVVRQKIIEQYPYLAGDLNRLALILTNKIMIDLTAAVNIKKQVVWKVARKFLEFHGLIKHKKRH